MVSSSASPHLLIMQFTDLHSCTIPDKCADTRVERSGELVVKLPLHDLAVPYAGCRGAHPIFLHNHNRVPNTKPFFGHHLSQLAFRPLEFETMPEPTEQVYKLQHHSAILVPRVVEVFLTNRW